jgi:hypothetical protein
MPLKKFYNRIFKPKADELSHSEDAASSDGAQKDECITACSASFDTVVETAKSLPKKEGQTSLWSAAFKLEKWHIIAKDSSPGVESACEGEQLPWVKVSGELKPFVGNVNGSGWIFAFTDMEHAVEFAEEYKLTGSYGAVRTIAVAPYEGVDWIVEYSRKRPAVTGLSFNEGKYGWHIPIENLDPIRTLLIKKRLIKRQKAK